MKGVWIMKRHHQGLFAVAVAGVICWILIRAYAPDPTTWPTYAAFRCRGCGGPASVDPDCLEQWGCRSCDYVTHQGHLHRHFRQAIRSDFATAEAFDLAQCKAGFLSRVEDWERLPISVWH